jgi:hypothetical protein
MFPRERGLESVKLTNGPDQLQPILTRVREYRDQVKVVQNLYEKETIPIGVIADAFGMNPIKFWQRLVQDGRRIDVCSGNHLERRAAYRVIHANGRRGCVVDPITLRVIRMLNIDDTVTTMCGRIGITHSTITTLRALREEVARSGHIAQDRYGRVTNNLIEANHFYTCVDYRALLGTAECTHWRVTGEFRRIASALAGESTDVASAIGVTADFLVELWRSVSSNSQARPFTNCVLDALLLGRWSNWTQIVAALSNSILDRVGSPTRRPYPQVMDAIEHWRRGRFLPSN